MAKKKIWIKKFLPGHDQQVLKLSPQRFFRHQHWSNWLTSYFDVIWHQMMHMTSKDAYDIKIWHESKMLILVSKEASGPQHYHLLIWFGLKNCPDWLYNFNHLNIFLDWVWMLKSRSFFRQQYRPNWLMSYFDVICIFWCHMHHLMSYAIWCHMPFDVIWRIRGLLWYDTGPGTISDESQKLSIILLKENNSVYFMLIRYKAVKGWQQYRYHSICST